MATTYTAIASQVLSSTAASITFSSIPGTYTDLVLKVSARTTYASNSIDQLQMKINGTSTGYSMTRIQGSGATATSSAVANDTSYAYPQIDAAQATTSTFSTVEYYVPNYVASTAKQLNIFGVQENNSASAYMTNNAALWNNTAAITSITLYGSYSGGLFAIGSRFDLYGITHI